MNMFSRCLLCFFMVLNSAGVWAEDVEVAVAANFIKPMEQLAAHFEQATGNTLVVSFGSSGKLLEQIRNGAPFKVFLSADQTKPQTVEDEKLDVPGSRFTYAIGKLVLWSAKEGTVDNQGEVLKTGSFGHIAIANPKTAPYGSAALETMGKLGVLEVLQAKIVQGESIAQTREFVSSGNAELGFIALSQVIRDGRISEGSGWLVSPELYSPLKQDAVLLKTGENSTGAKALMDYLHSDEARAVIESFGYDLPEVAKPATSETGKTDAR